MTHLILTADQEAASQYGRPDIAASTWLFDEFDYRANWRTGLTGAIRASTELEALDRIEEAWPDLAGVKWTGRSSWPPEGYNPAVGGQSL